MKKKLLQYLICFIVGALIAFLIMESKGLFTVNEPVEIAAILCDAFFVPGILFVMIGALVWISTTGLFDSLGYAFHVASHTLLPFLFKSANKSFYDYKAEKDESRAKTPAFVFIVGVVFLAASVIALIIWQNLSQ